MSNDPQEVHVYDVGDSVTVRGTFGSSISELSAQALVGATTIVVRDASGYAASDVLAINPGTDTEERISVSSVSGNTITLATALAYLHQPNETVFELADPTEVKLQTKDGNGAVLTYLYSAAAVTRDSVGRFSKAITLDGKGGDWVYRFAGTGAVIAARTRRMIVREMEF